MDIPRILTIAGSDSGGGAGIQADLKTISALGGFGMSVLTALTAQNTLGVTGIHEVPPAFVAAQFDAVATDIGIDAAKTGMLSSGPVMHVVAEKVRRYGIDRLVVDPVMVAKGGASLLAAEARATLLDALLPLACVATPNIPEAEVLAGMPVASLAEMEQAARIIHARGARNVLIKGGHLAGDAVDLLFDGRRVQTYRSARIATRDTHGTGCTFASAIATGLGRGLSVPAAVEQAKAYVTTAIRFSLRLGAGHGPTNHMAALQREAARYPCLVSLRTAADALEGRACGHLIPEGQSNLVFALPWAETREDVAGFPGRIVLRGGRVAAFPDPRFGASRRVADAVLAAMRWDPAWRSAMNVRFSEALLSVASTLGYRAASAAPTEAPPGSAAGEGLAVAAVLEEAFARGEGMPDLLCGRGRLGGEPLVLVWGKTPEEVVAKVRRLAEALHFP